MLLLLVLVPWCIVVVGSLDWFQHRGPPRPCNKRGRSRAHEECRIHRTRPDHVWYQSKASSLYFLFSTGWKYQEWGRVKASKLKYKEITEWKGLSENKKKGLKWKSACPQRPVRWHQPLQPSSLDLFARSRRSTRHNAAAVHRTHVCIHVMSSGDHHRIIIIIIIVTIIIVIIIICVHVYTCHVCIHAMSSGDPWFSSQSSHSREGSLATTWAEAQLHRGAFSVVTPCHGLSVAPRGTPEETGHHRDTWGHKRLRFLHSNLSVHQNASFDRWWWFTYPCYSHVRCKKNCPCPVLAWLGTLCGFKQISKPTRLIPSHSSISR